MKDEQHEAIANVINGLLSLGMESRQEIYQSIKNNEVVQTAVDAIKSGEIEDFQYGFLMSMKDAIMAVIEFSTDNTDLQFLCEKADFVEANIEKLFIREEGSTYCADKTRTVIMALAQFFISGEETCFNYKGEYTYHLPKTILKEHDDILSFFQGLKRLYYGEPKEYLIALNDVVRKGQLEKEPA